MNLNSFLSIRSIFLFELVLISKFGVCCLYETWPNSDIYISLVSLLGYSFFRNDFNVMLDFMVLRFIFRMISRLAKPSEIILTLLECFCLILELLF